jgi:hypothetical protein
VVQKIEIPRLGELKLSVPGSVTNLFSVLSRLKTPSKSDLGMEFWSDDHAAEDFLKKRIGPCQSGGLGGNEGRFESQWSRQIFYFGFEEKL